MAGPRARPFSLHAVESATGVRAARAVSLPHFENTLHAPNPGWRHRPHKCRPARQCECAHRPTSDQPPLNPATIGKRAARMAGKRPPARPTANARITPWQMRAGLSLKLNTTWVKPAPSVEVEKPSNTR